LIVRGLAAARLAKFARILWRGSDVGFFAASLIPGMSPIELNLWQVTPLALRWRINGSNPVSLEITYDSPAHSSAVVAPR